ncbi:class I SAM-dependent methyltransferase [Stutzerimonas kunmingensis]|uniref:class I SAM-dependent methyltransferase n=1 Tax=Stutzerimonas kunmingensis TaxID=1211807 RepID=UPI00241DCDEA|nr:class I SAM-dependent methyltransferase [Stutzerimonas kunmingensis]
MNEFFRILKIEKLPVQQNKVYRSQKEAINCPKGEVVLVQDQDTGVVYNSEFVPELMIYDENYQNEQGCSVFFKEHLSIVASIIKKHLGSGRAVEVGCGKGHFLEYLRSLGCEVVGVDPAYEGEAEYIKKTAFSCELGLSGDLVILRHVLEHISDPYVFLETIAEANGRSGLIYIEVPCLDWIAQNQAWFDVFYEHVNYFRLDNFKNLFGKIIDSGHLFGAQYIYVVAELSSLRKLKNGAGAAFELGSDFMAGVDRVVQILAENPAKQVVVWGGASKGVILAHHVRQKSDRFFSFAIDINPAKQDGFFPGTGLPVLSPEEGLSRMNDEDIILVMNSNYLSEIKSIAGSRFRYCIADKI